MVQFVKSLVVTIAATGAEYAFEDMAHVRNTFQANYPRSQVMLAGVHAHLQNTTLKNGKVWSKHRNDSSAKSEHIRKWDGCIHLGADFSGFLPARAHRLRCVIHAQHSTFDPGWDRRGECALPKCPGLGVVPFVSQ